MRLIPLLFCIILFASACSNRTESTETAQVDEKPLPLSDTVCFQRLEGSVNKDISAVKLIIVNNEVTGDFMYIPYEKDSRIGSLKGSRNGDIIKGLWTYMQEGIEDSLQVEFKILGDKLLQKAYSFDSGTGRQFLSDTSSFTIEHQKIDCSRFPQRSF